MPEGNGNRQATPAEKNRYFRYVDALAAIALGDTTIADEKEAETEIQNAIYMMRREINV